MRNWLLLFVACMAAGRVGAIDAAVNTIVYATPEKTYVEVCLEIAGASVQHVPMDSLSLTASVEVMMILRVEGTEDAFSVEKYQLNGPPVAAPSSLIDVRRFTVPAGRYNLEIKLRDVNNANNVHFMNRAFEVNVGAGIYLTDIQLLGHFYPEDGQTTFHRNGFFMEPLPSRTYDRGAPLLIFYAEVYHSNKSVSDPNFLVRYVVEEVLSDGKTKLWGSGNQRKAPSPIDAVLVQMDISNMNTGNYRITLELRNNANELIATRQLLFQRNNPLLAIDEGAITEKMVEKEFVQQLTPEELEYALRAVSPLVRMGDEPALMQSILMEKDPKAMRLFLFKYFVRLDANNPEAAYKNYLEVAKAVDNKFHSGFRYGFETDRGRTFLRYGKPDDVVREDNEPSAPPYEIWIYYNFPVTNQRNVKFLFYNPSLAGDDFIVLHSTARGEINNPRWERDLYARSAGEEYQGDNYHDATRMKDNVYRNARAYFEDF